MKWTEYSKQLREKCEKAGLPYSATFELTPYCNFACNMCYIHLTPEQAQKQGKLLSTEQWISLGEEAKKNGVVSLEITGGEAVTRLDFPALYTAFAKMGYMINLRSNGYLLRKGLITLLQQYKPKRVSITMYGASDETYRKICGIADGFSVVTSNILELREAGIDVQLTGTLTKENIDDKEMLQNWALSHGFSISFFGGLFSPIRAAKERTIDHLRLDSELENDLELNAVLQDRVIEDREKYLNPFWMCRGFGTKFCISWDGRMTLCNCFPAVWTEPMVQGIGNAFNDLHKQLGKLKRPGECGNCPIIDFCGNCPARLLSDAGDPEKTNKRICSIAWECYKQYQIIHTGDQHGEDKPSGTRDIKEELYCED